MRSLYLLVDLASLSVPLAYSFHPKLNFYREWRACLIAMLGTCALFLPWDSSFTAMGVWGFNPRYTLGVTIGNLPIEEILFFLCIPYSCLFTYFCLQRLLWRKVPGSGEPMRRILIALCLCLAVTHLDAWYTVTASSCAAFLLLVSRFVPGAGNLFDFYRSYLVLLIPFFIVNGILTGTGIPGEVVWYNDLENLGLRILTIPVDDFVYGFAMILMNVLLFENFRESSPRVDTP